MVSVQLTPQEKRTPLTQEEIAQAKMQLHEFIREFAGNTNRHYITDYRAYRSQKNSDDTARSIAFKKHSRLVARLKYQEKVKNQIGRPIKIKVKAGAYAIGERLKGYSIRGFGKTWYDAASQSKVCYAYFK